MHRVLSNHIAPTQLCLAMLRPKRQPDLRTDTVSKYACACLAKISLPPSVRILDAPCGGGRHTRWLAKRGFEVVAIDIDADRVAHARDISTAHHPAIMWQVADLEHDLPEYRDCFDLALVVDFMSAPALETITATLKPGGYLIFETFQARGQNWRALPLRETMRSALEPQFDLIDYQERPTGPDRTHAVVKAFAQKRIADL